MFHDLLKATFTLSLVLAAVVPAQNRPPSEQSKQTSPPAKPGRDSLGQIQAAPLDEVVPLDIRDLIIRGNQMMSAKRVDEAIAQYRAALDKAKSPVVTVYLNLGAAYLEKKDYHAAADFYRKAVDMRPGNALIRFSLADTLFALGNVKDAETEYRASIALTPAGVNPPAHHFLGLSLFGQQRVDEAIAEYRIAIEQLGGNYAEARYNLGLALLSRNELAAAEREFRTAIEQEKKDWPEAHFNLALTLEKMQRIREAADEYEVYLRLAPGSEDAAQLRKHIDKLRSPR